MNWKDFFYFSKGERRAFVVLLVLITLAWLTLAFWGEDSQAHTSMGETPVTVVHPVCIYIPATSSTLSNPSTSSAPSTPLTTSTSSTPSTPLTTSTSSAVSTPSGSQDTDSPGKGDIPLKKTIAVTSPTPPSSDKPSFYRQSPRAEKYPKGTVVELNTADTTILKKVPGIGSAFSNRIVKYRKLLGGFYSVSQLSEVYGIDEERYEALKEWFCVNPELVLKRSVHHLPADSLSRHPYINYRQARVLKQLCRRPEGLNTWDELLLLDEFKSLDDERIRHYLSFEK